MPLPGIDEAKQCTARAKRSGNRCKNPAVVSWGNSNGTVCRMHGARKKSTVKQGRDHPCWKHGRETLGAKAARHEMSVFFHEVENLMHAFDMVAPGSTRWRGRKPN